jgi:hypothetical protein
LRKSGNSICTRCDARPLTRRTKSLTAICGGISTNIWTCARNKTPDPAEISHPALCGLALPQSQKAREIFFCVAERLDIEIGLFGLGQPVAKTSLAVSTSFEGTKAIESAGWPAKR